MSPSMPPGTLLWVIIHRSRLCSSWMAKLLIQQPAKHLGCTFTTWQLQPNTQSLSTALVEISAAPQWLSPSSPCHRHLLISQPLPAIKASHSVGKLLSTHIQSTTVSQSTPASGSPPSLIFWMTKPATHLVTWSQGPSTTLQWNQWPMTCQVIQQVHHILQFQWVRQSVCLCCAPQQNVSTVIKAPQGKWFFNSWKNISPPTGGTGLSGISSSRKVKTKTFNVFFFN